MWEIHEILAWLGEGKIEAYTNPCTGGMHPRHLASLNPNPRNDVAMLYYIIVHCWLLHCCNKTWLEIMCVLVTRWQLYMWLLLTRTMFCHLKSMHQLQAISWSSCDSDHVTVVTWLVCSRKSLPMEWPCQTHAVLSTSIGIRSSCNYVLICILHVQEFAKQSIKAPLAAL